MAKDQPRKPHPRPRRRLKAALRLCRDEGFPIRSATIDPDGGVRIDFGSRSDPPADGGFLAKRAPRGS